MTGRKGTACFVVSGETITELAREFVLEGNDLGAIDFLRKSLEGFDYDHAVSLLRGDRRLVGTNALDLVDEEPAARGEYRGRLMQAFGGTRRLRVENRVWHFRPYAVVTSWCAADVPRNSPDPFINRWHADGAHMAAPVRLPGFTSKLAAWGLARCVYYMENPRDDRAVVLPAHGTVLWRSVPPPPFWWPCHSEWLPALEEHLAIRGRLETRGAEQLRGRDLDELCREQRSQQQSRRTARQEAADAELLDDEVEKFDELLGEPRAGPPPATLDSARAAVEKEIFGGHVALELPPEVVGPEHDYGYIDRDGKFYGCDYFGHRTLGLRILKHLKGVDVDDEKTNAEAELDRLGLIHVGVPKATAGPPLRAAPLKHPTPQQIKAAIEWAVAHRWDPQDIDFLAQES